MKFLNILTVFAWLSLVAGLPQPYSYRGSPNEIKGKEEEGDKALAKTMEFVNAQFENFQLTKNCAAFANSFTEPFDYCDAMKDCISTIDALETECMRLGPVAENILDNLLEIKPTYEGEDGMNYLKIAITGKQTMLPYGEIETACIDFVIIEELKETRSGDLTSILWHGYYTISTDGRPCEKTPDVVDGPGHLTGGKKKGNKLVRFVKGLLRRLKTGGKKKGYNPEL